MAGMSLPYIVPDNLAVHLISYLCRHDFLQIPGHCDLAVSQSLGWPIDPDNTILLILICFAWTSPGYAGVRYRIVTPSLWTLVYLIVGVVWPLEGVWGFR